MGTIDLRTTDDLATRLFEATTGALELLTVHVALRLGLYPLLASHGPSTEVEVAERADLDLRYARELLEQQAAAGIIHVDDPAKPPESRRYDLPAAHVPVLVDPEDPAHVAPFATMVAGIAGALPEVLVAHRSGAGVPFERFGADMRDGQGAANRPKFTHELAGWVAAMPDVAAPLHEGGARILDVGCGQGWGAIALARAFPGAEVVGVDTDAASLEDARRHAQEAGVRVRLQDRLDDDPASFACILEALHDMADPVGVLAHLRRVLRPGGAVLVVDERVGPAFTAPGDQIERTTYAFSVLHCLPASRAEHPSAAIGTVLREGRVRDLAAEAGFRRVEVLPVEDDAFRLYRLDP